MLQRKMKRSFEKNMEKFNLYSARNIFSAPSASLPKEQRLCDENIPDYQIKEKAAHQKILLANLEDECNNMSQSLKDIRTTLFSLRVVAQAFEDSDVQPMAETVANLAADRDRLIELCSAASGEPFLRCCMKSHFHTL